MTIAGDQQRVRRCGLALPECRGGSISAPSRLLPLMMPSSLRSQSACLHCCSTDLHIPLPLCRHRREAFHGAGAVGGRCGSGQKGL